ncbi:MAG: hypothetical protein CVU48_07765 [Candidatus Cloacimonetes bacterium HGW-Cloacimonetes-1]|jgi:hypothetical protein|nr:MAG: hypothetical protein CVU48_07765 [Candidatus Cloacimonetes bacterium HGW-Cloacimonetes-1]
MKKLTLSLLFVTAGLISLFAGNSVFSYYGSPYQYYGNDMYSMGMGDAGATDIFRNNTGYANPAQFNTSKQSLFSTGMLFGYTKYQSDVNGTQKFTDNSMDFPFFSMSIPVRNQRFGFQFNSFSSGLDKNQIAIDSLGITEKQSMDRYMYRADLIYSYNIKRLHLGASANYYFGHDTRTFEQTGSYGVFNTKEKLENAYKNPTFTLGAIQAFDKLSIGAYFTMPVTLKGDQIRSSIHEVEPAVDYEHKLPAMISGGFTYLPTPQLKISTDLNYEQWSDTNCNYDDSWRLAVGIAREPQKSAARKKIMDLPMRVGASYRTLAFKGPNDSSIDEYSASCGISVPLKKENNCIDLGFKFTNRGNLSNNNLQDTSYMLLLGFTGFDFLTKQADRTAPRYIPEAEVLAE